MWRIFVLCMYCVFAISTICCAEVVIPCLSYSEYIMVEGEIIDIIPWLDPVDDNTVIAPSHYIWGNKIYEVTNVVIIGGENDKA